MPNVVTGLWLMSRLWRGARLLFRGSPYSTTRGARAVPLAWLRFCGCSRPKLRGRARPIFLSRHRFARVAARALVHVLARLQGLGLDVQRDKEDDGHERAEERREVCREGHLGESSFRRQPSDGALRVLLRERGREERGAAAAVTLGSRLAWRPAPAPTTSVQRCRARARERAKGGGETARETRRAAGERARQARHGPELCAGARKAACGERRTARASA